MQGKKTHEQQLRILERKEGQNPEAPALQPQGDHPPREPEARQAEFPVSRGGLHQESQHNKHNDPGQAGHKPQTHTAAEEGE
jgi:hypothetical protein